MPRQERTRAKDEIGRVVIEEIQSHLDRSTSPVSGGSFKKKKVNGTNSILLEMGDMRDSIEFKRRRGDSIEVGVFKSREIGKAYGHNTDFKGHPHLAGKGHQRQFIPDENEKFKGRIEGRIKEVVENFKAFEEAKKDLKEGNLTIGQILEQVEPIPAVTESNQLGPTFSLGSLIGDVDGEG